MCEVKPNTSDNDDDDDSLSSRECEETIRAGDIIEYWDPSTFTVGDPRGRGTATVIRVDTVEEEYPLILDNSTLLPNYSKIRRLKNSKGQERMGWLMWYAPREEYTLLAVSNLRRVDQVLRLMAS